MIITGNFVKVSSRVIKWGPVNIGFWVTSRRNHIEPGTKKQQDLNQFGFVDNSHTELKLTANYADLSKKSGVELTHAETSLGLRPSWND